jgi:hypothetical protein
MRFRPLKKRGGDVVQNETNWTDTLLVTFWGERKAKLRAFCGVSQGASRMPTLTF